MITLAVHAPRKKPPLTTLPRATARYRARGYASPNLLATAVPAAAPAFSERLYQYSDLSKPSAFRLISNNMYTNAISSDRPRRLVHATLAILSVLPPVLLAICLLRYGVNLPVMDDWEIGVTLSNWAGGRLTFHELLSQHNESRTFFPRLISILLASLGSWDVRREMWASFATASLISANIYCLIRRTITSAYWFQMALYVICNALIFSLVQWDNWFWGIQLVLFMPVACLLVGVNVCQSRLPLVAKTMACMILCTVATFSFANGVLCWPLLFILLFISGKNGRRTLHKAGLALMFLSALVACLGLYVHNFRSSSGAAESYDYALDHPQIAREFAMAFLGNPLGGENLALAESLGWWLVAAFLYALIYALLWNPRPLLLRRLQGWLALGGYVLASATLATAGRCIWGPEGGIAPRYATFSIYLLVCVLGAGMIIAQDLHRRRTPRASRSRLLAPCLIGAAAAIFCLMLFSASRVALSRIEALSLVRRNAKVAVWLQDLVWEDALLKHIYIDKEGMFAISRNLDAAGLLSPPLLRPYEAQALFAPHDDHAAPEDGRLGLVRREGTNALWVAMGWASDLHHHPVDAVVLTYTQPGGATNVPFALSTDRFWPKPVPLQGDAGPRGWIARFEATRLPAGPLRIHAWAVDADTATARRCAGEILLTNTLAMVRE